MKKQVVIIALGLMIIVALLTGIPASDDQKRLQQAVDRFSHLREYWNSMRVDFISAAIPNNGATGGTMIYIREIRSVSGNLNAAISFYKGEGIRRKLVEFSVMTLADYNNSEAGCEFEKSDSLDETKCIVLMQFYPNSQYQATNLDDIERPANPKDSIMPSDNGLN